MDARRDGARSAASSSRVPGMSLVEQVEMFGSVAASSPDSVVATDTDARVVWVNPAAAALFGLAADELAGRPVTDLVHEDARPRLVALHRQVVAGEQPRPFPVPGLRSDGRVLELSVTPAVRRDDRGRAVGATMVLRDVTEEARLRHELAEAVARSRARFDESAQPQALLDVEGRVVEVNDAACELLGRRRDELLGGDATAVVRPTAPDGVRHQLDRLRTGSARSATYEAVGAHRDGRQIPILVDVTAVRDPDGKAYELAVLVRDLRELRDAERRLASQAAFFRGLHREAADVTLVADASGAVRYVTPSVTQVLGYDPEHMRALATSLVHPDDVAGGDDRRRRVLEVSGTRERATLRIRDAEGRWRWFDTTATNCLHDPDIAGVVINLREVTPEIEAQQALRDSEARYRAIAETAQEGILAVSPEGDTLFANERLADILGLSMEEVYALGGTGIFPSADVGRAGRRLGARRPQAGPERSDVAYRHPDGSDRVLLVSASPLTAADGSVLGSLAMVSDVTEQRAAEATLRRQALHDALTGLPNRLLFVDRLTLAAARQRRSRHGATAVLFLDLDDFKLVNDRHGHQTGDRVLVEVAARLGQAVRTTDTVARLGGDEFAVICEGADAATAALVASRIQETFGQPVEVDGRALEISLSIGVALSPPHQAEDLLRLADMAMYQAKATARGRVVTYHEGLPDDTTRRLGVLRALGEALDEGSVPLCYEPVVDLATVAVRGLHAGLCWDHPALGPLPGDEVVRTADDAGLGVDLQAALLRTAVREVGELRRRSAVAGETSLVVHLPSSVLRDPRLSATLEEALDPKAVPPDRVLLMIDEGTVGEDPGGAAALASDLRRTGAGVGVNGIGLTGIGPTDAGVEAAAARGRDGDGFDSLWALRPAALELDGAVVRRLAGSSTDGAALRELTGPARAAGVPTVAEGVTTEDEAVVLRELGCDLGRGPLWGTPRPWEGLADQWGGADERP